MTQPPRLLIRADGGRTIGSGHLGRCLAIAEVWAAGGQVTLASRRPPATWKRRWEAVGAEVVSPARVTGAHDAVVVDGYRLAADEVWALGRGRPLLCVDDRGLSPCHRHARVIVDANLGSTPEDYPMRAPDASLLLGPRYALLRSDARAGAGRHRAVPRVARRLLVAMGGEPSAATLTFFEQVVADPALASMERLDLAGVDATGPVIAEADVALLAAGSTVWEVAAMGVPAVLVPVAANQEPVALGIAGAAAGRVASMAMPPSEVARMVSDLARDQDVRRSMAEVGRTLVDGSGAARVVAALRGRLLNLRPAESADVELLWRWANDEHVRRASFNQAPISLDEHARWFADRLAEPTTRIYIASDARSEPIGQMRVECEDGIGHIGVSVDAGARGHGWASALIDAASRRALDELAAVGLQVLEATIKSGNTRSERAFVAADFDGPAERSRDRVTYRRGRRE